MMITLLSIYFTFVTGKCPSSFDFKSMTSIGDKEYENCADTIGNDLEIPSSVTGIGYNAFYGCTGITGRLIININNNQIGDSAFYGCTGITEVSIGEKISSISANCFRYCSNLTKVSFPNGLREIANGAFYQCHELAINIDLPELFIFGTFSFYNCTKLSSITFNTQYPIEISNYAFSCCNGLKSLTLPSNIKKIYNYAFSNCTKLRSINIKDCTNDIGIGLFERCTSLSGTIEIPSKWTTIKKNTFAYCNEITGLTLHDNLNQIDDRAFYKCSQLTGRLIILNSNMKIENEAFSGCRNLQQITNFDKITEIGDAAFAECSSLTSVLEFNSAITTIPSYLFYKCSSIVGPLKITSIISSINEYAFYDCSQLTIDSDFDLSNLDYINDYSFYNCKSISGDLILSDDIIEIGSYAFYNCSKLTGELIINVSEYNWVQNSVKIGDYAFYGCTGFIGDFIINSCIGSIGKEAFGLTNFDQIIYNFSYAPFCSESIGENIDIFVPVNYEPDSFCQNKFIRDIPYYGIFDEDDDNIIVIETYGIYNYDDFYINYFAELLSSENNENKTYINYFDYDNNNKVRSLIFNNEMKPNQYFELYYHSGIEIYYYGGQLNLLNPGDIINIIDTYDFNISIMGTGYLTFDQKYNPNPDDTTKYHINIFSNSTFIDTFQFKLLDSNKEIESISIEDVTLVYNGSILPIEYAERGRENNVVPKLEIKKLTVKQYANATIESAKITGPFIIKHNSKIKLIDVDLSDAEMIYEMNPYINKNNILTDSIISKPKSFTVLEPENPKRNFKKEYILIDANFDCLNWNISIGPNSKYFDKYECFEIKSSSILADSNDLKHYQLKLITKDDIPPIKDDDNENNSNDKDKNGNNSDKLSIGAIIGIVVGCIVVVAALMIAEYFIITRCKRNKDASKNEGNEEI